MNIIEPLEDARLVGRTPWSARVPLDPHFPTCDRLLDSAVQ
jgi:hypothetical protein